MAEPAAGGFDIRRMLLLGGVVTVMLVAVLFFLVRGCAPTISGGNQLTTIYSNLDLKDAANVVARLKELNIPYEIREQGKSIAVAKDKADLARISLAEKNLPAGGVVGWEIFDESKLGATDFDRRIQLIRAISGELSRTILRIQAIDDARVQIVIPETNLFAENKAPVTASVLLRLKIGAELSAEQINGIIHLVASSVENLQPENVTIVDTTGRILNSKQLVKAEVENLPEAPLPPQTPPQVVISEEAGPKIKLNVSFPSSTTATTNIKVIATTSTTLPKVVSVAPPENIIKATLEAITKETPSILQKHEEKANLKTRVKKDVEQELAGKAQEILNRFYPINSIIVKVNVELKNYPTSTKYTLAELKIKKLTAIILIDNRVQVNAQLKKTTLKSAAAAIGYSKKRGDRIIVQKVPFHLATPPIEAQNAQINNLFAKQNGIFLGLSANLLYGIAAVVIIFILFLFIRRGRKKKSTVQPFSNLNRPTEASSPPPPTTASTRPSVVDSLRDMVDKNPEKIADLLRSWLTE